MTGDSSYVSIVIKGADMFKIVLIFALAQCAYAANLGAITVSTVGVNSFPGYISPGPSAGVSSALLNTATDIVDTADVSVYVDILLDRIGKLADRIDLPSKAIAAAQAFAVLGEIAPGRPGDSCAYTGVINGTLGAVQSYVNHLSALVDIIVQLDQNPQSVRGISAPEGVCQDDGRYYNLDAPWNIILSTNIGASAELNDIYYIVQTLYDALSVRSNVVAAATTAAITSQGTQVAITTYQQLVDFLVALATDVNVVGAAAVYKNALNAVSYGIY